MTLPPSLRGRLAALAAAFVWASGACAAEAEKPAGSGDPIAIFPGTSSKEPISIDADKLVYYDKEHKAIYTGSVVVVQGDTKMTCAVMTVFLDRAPAQGAKPPADGQAAPHGRLGRQAARGDRAGDRDVQNPGRHQRQRQLRQRGRQGVADRPRHPERRPKRHQRRQADLRSQDRPGDNRHQRQVRSRPRTIRSEIERRRHEAGAATPRRRNRSRSLSIFRRHPYPFAICGRQ